MQDLVCQDINWSFMYVPALSVLYKGPVTLSHMRETYEKCMKINEIIFVRMKIPCNASI